MLAGILNGVPIWVWPLFVALLLLGLKATKRRSTPIWVPYALSLLGLLSLNTVSNLGNSYLVWAVFGIACFVGAFIGFAKQQKWLITKEQGQLVLAGEWMTLTTMMIVFLANFVAGTLKAISPGLYQSDGFIFAFTAVIALASGIFLGRAWRIIRS